jgi:hypothetical protein
MDVINRKLRATLETISSDPAFVLTAPTRTAEAVRQAIAENNAAMDSAASDDRRAFYAAYGRMLTIELAYSESYAHKTDLIRRVRFELGRRDINLLEPAPKPAVVSVAPKPAVVSVAPKPAVVSTVREPRNYERVKKDVLKKIQKNFDLYMERLQSILSPKAPLDVLLLAACEKHGVTMKRDDAILTVEEWKKYSVHYMGRKSTKYPKFSAFPSAVDIDSHVLLDDDVDIDRDRSRAVWSDFIKSVGARIAQYEAARDIFWANPKLNETLQTFKDDLEKKLIDPVELLSDACSHNGVELSNYTSDGEDSGGGDGMTDAERIIHRVYDLMLTQAYVRSLSTVVIPDVKSLVDHFPIDGAPNTAVLTEIWTRFRGDLTNSIEYANKASKPPPSDAVPESPAKKLKDPLV